MRIQSSASILFLLPALASATGFDCKHIVVDGIKYNLGPLGGAHSVYHVDETKDYVVNTTYVLNICNTLSEASNRGDLKCGKSKNICGFQYTKNTDGSHSSSSAFPIVGLNGTKDPKITRLKEIDSNREGLLLKMSGEEYSDGKDGNDNKKKKSVGAVIEFKCDPDRSGLEGIRDVADGSTEDQQQQQQTRQLVRADENDSADNNSESLQFKSFGLVDDDSYVLKLDWRTRYACDDYLKNRNDEQSSSSRWGFFTWLIIILFLCIAAYLIFGSWLNYNRYGARGWDLLPHGDTIRDIPYLFQDWLRRIVNTLQGTGTRGGYSAV